MISDLSLSLNSQQSTINLPNVGFLLMIAVSAGTFACVLALPAHSLREAHQLILHDFIFQLSLNFSTSQRLNVSTSQMWACC